jgi:PIN domain nuclease of toxin-antitoxin system
MATLAADTHAVIWFLEGSSRLTKTAADAMRSAEVILVPTICLVEIAYLVEKGRLHNAWLHRLFAELDNPATTLEPAALDLRVALARRMFPASTCRTCPIASSPPPRYSLTCLSSPVTAGFVHRWLKLFGNEIRPCGIENFGESGHLPLFNSMVPWRCLSRDTLGLSGPWPLRSR